MNITHGMTENSHLPSEESMLHPEVWSMIEQAYELNLHQGVYRQEPFLV
jgi:hypothetical protein